MYDAEIRNSSLISDYGRDAYYVFGLGRVQASLNNVDEAYRLFTEAKDLDPILWRAPTTINNSIRSFASRDDVSVIDLVRTFGEYSDNHVGFGLTGDNVHRAPIGNAIIAREIIGEMKHNGIMIADDREIPAETTILKNHRAHLGERQLAESLFNLNFEFGVSLTEYSHVPYLEISLELLDEESLAGSPQMSRTFAIR